MWTHSPMLSPIGIHVISSLSTVLYGFSNETESDARLGQELRVMHARGREELRVMCQG